MKRSASGPRADGSPEPVRGLSNAYAAAEKGGTGYLRLEFVCRTEKEIESYRKDYETRLSKQLSKAGASLSFESVVVLSAELQKKLKLPNQALQRTGS